jgi:hypothetical protein
MRSEKRIKRILDKINIIWSKVPDERFYQMLINSGLIPDGDMWHIEDTDVEEHIDNLIKNMEKK